MRLHEAIKEFVELKKFKGVRSQKTAVRYESTLRIFCLCMQDPLLEDIEFSHIIWYLKELERLGWKPNGINLVGLALKKFFEFCQLRKYPVAFNENLIPLKEKTFSIPRVTDLETFKKLLKQIPEASNHAHHHAHHIRNRAILLMLWDTGVRVGELMSLDITDLDLKNRTALIKTEKSRGRRPVRQIFWTAETHQHLLRWIEKLKELRAKFTFKDSDALFVSISKSSTQPVRGCRLTPRGVAEVMRMLSNQAGLPITANAHGIRHSMGRDTVKTLRSNSAVSNILGHSNIESSYIYTMIWGDELKEQWQEVMNHRGNPLASPPRRAVGFPKLKNEPNTVVKGQIRSVKIKTSSTARWVRS
ncbi:MAG TPA: tyrosine-type recombinase/integrase [Bacteroidia bacterium]|nr:tyrosine-type recombinase/integrase [Bacteroidia bacterium]